MKFICPNCQSEKEPPVVMAGSARCADCGQWFPEPTDIPAVTPAAPDPVEQEERRRKNRVADIRNTAGNWRAAGIFFALVGLVILLGSAIAAISGSPVPSGWICGSGLIAVAFWMYLVAQVIHIRANTHK